ncbi:hypothetical protein MMC07_000849 [Pseudocyphellaria aurata]|nr:hypothetical protein [Pseudocyphellaria aurata]
MFALLYTKRFPPCASGPVYLVPRNPFLFVKKVEFRRFTSSSDGIGPSMKHGDQIRLWPVPRSKEEVERFPWLDGQSLQQFRAKHVLAVRRPYRKVVVELAASTKKSVKTGLAETGAFIWGRNGLLEWAVSDNVAEGAGPKSQYHLATDVSKFCAGGVLFQLKDQPPGTEATDQHRTKIRISIFLLFRLDKIHHDVLTTTERKVNAIIQCLFHLHWLIMGRKYPTRLYPDLSALESILKGKPDAPGRIARLTELNKSINAQALDLFREAEAGRLGRGFTSAVASRT